MDTTTSNGGLWDQSTTQRTQGVWGPPTSAVNFCEQDYAITIFIAEFINTLTSLAYIGYGGYGIRRWQRRNVAIFAPVNFTYWALIGVGVFSGLYHTTLKYHTQMSDELSMHLAIGALLHQVFTFGEPPAIQRRNTFIILGIIVPFVIYHCLTDEFILHLLLFFGMSLTVAYRISHIIKLRIKDAGQRRKLRTLVRFATSSALLAFFIWNVDNLFCPTLTRWKQKVGKPWAFLLEGHGYWHMLTAMSSYCFMALSEFLTSPEGHESTGVGFGWPASVVLRDLGTMPKANGHVDGTRNGPMEKERAKDK